MTEEERRILLLAAENRHSVRAFTQQKIPKEVVSILKENAEKYEAESGVYIRFVTEEAEAFGGFMAHYGKFSNVRNYFVFGGGEKESRNEKIGYYGELLALQAQAAGLNTCWVALTASKKKAAAAAGFPKGSKAVCVMAVGYGKTQGVPHKGKPLEKICGGKVPLPDWFMRGAECAALAPTALNQQKFYLEYLGEDAVSLKKGRGFYTDIDLGIVRFHFELGAGEENFHWKK